MTTAALLLALALQLPAEVIDAIRVHGNHATPEADVLALAGLAVGGAGGDAQLEDARRRLEASGRFEHVEVRKRFASLDDSSRILVVLLVDERAGATPADPMPGPWTRMTASTMWLPIVEYADGYGLSYGARVSFVDALGPRSRVSVPLAWGAERRALVEIERRFDDGPVTRVTAAAGWRRSENPHYEFVDARREAQIVVERAFARTWRLSGGARAAHVSVDGDGHDVRALHTAITFDTRVDPIFPRNAVLLSAGAERFYADDGAGARWRAEAQAYQGLPRAAVFAVRVSTTLSERPLPVFERALLGGSQSVRGTAAGAAAGDNILLASVELRVPLTSPLRFGRFGVKAFADTGTVWDAGEAFRSQRFERGIGAGVFVGAAVFSGGVDVAFDRDGKARVHAGFGVTFRNR